MAVTRHQVTREQLVDAWLEGGQAFEALVMGHPAIAASPFGQYCRRRGGLPGKVCGRRGEGDARVDGSSLCVFMCCVLVGLAPSCVCVGGGGCVCGQMRGWGPRPTTQPTTKQASKKQKLLLPQSPQTKHAQKLPTLTLNRQPRCALGSLIKTSTCRPSPVRVCFCLFPTKKEKHHPLHLETLGAHVGS
jgi:hypothetical protein